MPKRKEQLPQSADELLAALQSGHRLRWLPRGISGERVSVAGPRERDLWFDHRRVPDDTDSDIYHLTCLLIRMGKVTETQDDETGIIDYVLTGE